jgi:hypothetical protein
MKGYGAGRGGNKGGKELGSGPGEMAKAGLGFLLRGQVHQREDSNFRLLGLFRDGQTGGGDHARPTRGLGPAQGPGLCRQSELAPCLLDGFLNSLLLQPTGAILAQEYLQYVKALGLGSFSEGQEAREAGKEKNPRPLKSGSGQSRSCPGGVRSTE